MRVWTSAVVMVLLLGLTACDKKDDSPAARKAGRAAYEVTEESKKLAKEAERKLKQAGHEAHEGWKDAEKDAKAKPK